jgi:putative colanic acid biosynthesis UDP-glucose lipid carrier transferase
MPRSVLKPYATLFAGILRAIDPVVTVAVGLAAYRAYLGSFLPPEHYILFIAGGAFAVAALFPLFRLYQPQRGMEFADELRQLLLAWLVVAAIAGIGIFATKTGDYFSRVWVSSWLTGGLLATATVRISMRLALRSLRRRGLNLRHIAIVGAGTLGAMIVERLQAATWTGLNVVGFYDDDATKLGATVAGRPVLGTTADLANAVDTGQFDQVWIALPLRAEERVRTVLAALRASAVEVRFVPDIYGFHLLNHSVTEIAGMPVVSLTESPMTGANRGMKALEDYVLATVASLLLTPVMLLIALGVKLTSAGPVLYRQERVTWNGERFAMLKFRTMAVDAEAASGPVWSRSGEQRATGFGAFLRRYSLDELPQLINVLAGEMSLVGPRPERPEFVDRFRQQIPGYMQKHLVKAGITGWAQVNDLRGDSDLERRIQYDLYYIEHWSLWFDLRILALTLWHTLKSRHAH